MFAVEKYRKATSVEEAVRLLAADPFAIPIAGGTDVLVKLREGHGQYANLVDIHGLAELKTIELLQGGTLAVGAGACFADIIDSPLVREHAPVLAEGASWVAGPQIRNVATIGGNICNGSVCADSVPPLLVLDAQVELAGPDGPRRTPLLGFHTGPGAVARRHDEVMTRVLVPPAPEGAFGAASIKYSMRQAMDIATLGCAAAVLLEGGLCVDVRLAFSVAGPVPVRCSVSEAAARGLPVEDAAEAVRQNAARDITPRDSWRAPADLRRHLAGELAARALAKAAARAEYGRNA